MLKGKKVLIVGGSSGIGFAVARHAQNGGANVIIASRSAAARAATLSEALGGAIEVHSFDVTREDEAHRLFDAVGPIDHLVVTVRPEIAASSFEGTRLTDAKRAFDGKFWGPYGLIQAGHRVIRKSGSITLTSGIAGEKIYRNMSTMAIINVATETLCRCLAVELAPIRINAVSPGFVEPKPDAVKKFAQSFPLKRLATLDDVAGAYFYLMTSPYQTGIVLHIDGGARLV